MSLLKRWAIHDHPYPRQARRDMTGSTSDPLMMARDGGRVITGGAVHARLLVAHDHPCYASTFEVTVAPGFDVGAHVHDNGEEMFYLVDGELDVLCFEPADRTPADWHAWSDAAGRTFMRGQPGAFMYVPPRVPHAFANPTDRPVTMLFQSSVAGGHENYFNELGALLSPRAGPPDPGAVRQLEAKYGTEQLTSMRAAVKCTPSRSNDPGSAERLPARYLPSASPRRLVPSAVRQEIARST